MASAVAVSIMLTGCGDDPPSPPSNGQNGGDVQISGGERLGWNQLAANPSELASFRYAIYIDGVRSELSGVSCGMVAGAAGFDCSAPLLPMTIGSHTIELATFIIAGSVLESARSSSLRVRVVGVIGAGVTQSSSRLVMTAEQVVLNLDVIADGLNMPSDLAFAPDGAIYIAERAGTVRVLREGVMLPEPALDLSADISLPEGGLLGLALDPKFADTRIVYALYASQASARSGLAFTLARFRDAQGIYGERAILLDRVPASANGATGTLRVGPDGKLYVGFDDAADRRAPGNPGSYNGKILRLNPDATTPADQAGFSPIYSVDHPLPKALDWQPASGRLWVVDAADAASGRLVALTEVDARAKRAVTKIHYKLPAGSGAASAAFYRGQRMPMFRDNLFIAAEHGRQLIRLRFDPQDPVRVISAEFLLQDQVGPVRVVAVGPDEALYICSDRALFRLAP